MTGEEYIAATKPTVDFLMNIYPHHAILAQLKKETDVLISLLEEVVSESQRHIAELKTLEK